MTDPFSIIMFVVAIGLTVYRMVSAPKPKAPQGPGRTQVSGVDVIADGQPEYLPVVYGRSRVAGVRAYTTISPSFVYIDISDNFQRFNPTANPSLTAILDKSGAATKNSVLTTQIAIAHGPINRVVEVLIEDTTSDNPSFAYRSNNTTHKDAEVANRLPEASWQIDVCTNGVAPNTATNVKGFTHPRGSSTAYFADIAYATCTFKIDEFELQWNGIPDTAFLVEGMKVQKWMLSGNTPVVDGPKVYSANPSWCLLDYLTNTIYGKGIDVGTEVNIESFIKAAIVCDQRFKESNAADALDKGYKIGGAINKAIPTDQYRAIFECNITLDTGKPMRDNIETLLTTMNGAVLTWSNGRYNLLVIHPTSMTALNALRYLDGVAPLAGQEDITLLTDNDLVLDQQIDVSWPDASTKLNQVTIHFKNEARNFKDDAITWPVLYQDAEIPVAATSEVITDPVGRFVWTANANGRDYSKYAFVGMFAKFGIANRGDNAGATDTFRIHRVGVTGSYSIEAVCTARIDSIRVIREYPTVGLVEQELLNLSTCATPQFYNDESKIDDPSGTKFYYNTLVGSTTRPIGYNDGTIGSGATRLTIGGQEAKLNILPNEDMYLRIEVTYSRTVGLYFDQKDSTDKKKKRQFEDYSPNAGVSYGICFIDYSAGHNILWQTGQQYYTEFKIASPNEKATLDAAKALHDSLIAEDGNVILERDYTIPGISTIYHAWFRAEELVRASRFSFKVTFKYLVKTLYLEPGDVFAIQSVAMGWDTPITLRVTSSSLNEENVCSVQADYISTDLYIKGVNLPNFTSDIIPPVYIGTSYDMRSFDFISEVNSTIGSPGTLIYAAQFPNLVKGFEISACYDMAKASDGSLSFAVIVPETHAREVEVPPTTATTAIYRIRAISYNDIKGSPAYSILEGSHTLSRFGNMLILTCDQDALIYSDNKPVVSQINLKAILNVTDLSGKVYTWKVNGVVVPTLIGNDVMYTLPTTKPATSLEISVSVTDTDIADLAFSFTDTIKLPVLAGPDSPPLLEFADTLLVLERDNMQLPKTIALRYYLKGVLTTLPNYTITAVGCTAEKVATGVKITAITSGAPSIYVIATYNDLASTTKVALVTNTTFNISVNLISEDKLVAKYKSDNTLDPPNYTISFVAELNIEDISAYTFEFYVNDVLNPNSIANTFVYYPTAQYANMPETIKVLVKRVIGTTVTLVAADYVTILGLLDTSGAEPKMQLANAFKVLSVNLDSTTSMDDSGTYGDVYIGTTALRYSATSVDAVNAQLGTYNVVATQTGLSGLSNIPIVANSSSSDGFHTDNYSAMLATTNEATVTFVARVKDLKGDIVDLLPITQTLIRQTSFAVTKQVLDAASLHVLSTSDDVSVIPVPTSIAINYVADADDDGTTSGTISWEYPANYTAIDGFVVCYTTTKLNEQLDLNHLDVISSAVSVKVGKAIRSCKIDGLGTTKYVCAFIFAYRKATIDSYDGFANDLNHRYKTPDNDLWIVSFVARSHTNGSLSKYTSRLVVNTDIKDKDGNLLQMSDVFANLEDFNSKNNSSTAALPEVTFRAPGIIYNNTKVNSGNIDFAVLCKIPKIADLTLVDGIAVLCEEYLVSNSINLSGIIPSEQVIATNLNTVFVPIDSPKVDSNPASPTIGDWWFNIPFDEMKVNVFRNAFIFAYREVDIVTYNSASYIRRKFQKNGRNFFCSDAFQLILKDGEYSIYNGSLTTSAELKLPDGTVVHTADLYANLVNTSELNDASVFAISTPIISTSNGIVYSNTYTNSGNIDYILNFGSLNAVPNGDKLHDADSIDGFAILEVITGDKTDTIIDITAEKIMTNPDNVIVLATSYTILQNQMGQTAYAVEIKEAKASPARSIFMVAYREVSTVTYAKTTTNTKVKVGKRMFFCSSVARSHPNGALSLCTLPLTTTAELKTIDGVVLNTTKLYENYLDFNSGNNNSFATIDNNIANMRLSYLKDTDPTTALITSVHPSGNVDITLEFEFGGIITGPDSIDGFCVLLEGMKTNGTIPTPTFDKMFKNANSKFIDVADPVVAGKYAVVFEDISPVLFRTAFVFPFRRVSKPTYDKYDTPLVRVLPDTVANRPQYKKFVIKGKEYICVPNIAPARSHASTVLYQAMTEQVMQAFVATEYGNLSVANGIGDFNLSSNEGLMGDVSVLAPVDTSTVTVVMAGNKSGTIDITLNWEYPALARTGLDGFIIDIISNDKTSTMSKSTITKLKGYVTVDETGSDPAYPDKSSYTFLNQPVKSFYNFTIIPYHVISELTIKKATTIIKGKGRVARVSKVPILYEATYGLVLPTGVKYSKRDTQGPTQPTLATTGDYWLNTSATSTAGVPTLRTARFDGTSWEPLTTTEYAEKAITQTVELTQEPTWTTGYYFKNVSTETVAGIVSKDTAKWDDKLGIWVSLQTKPMFFNYPVTNLNSYPPNTNSYFLASVAPFLLYKGFNGKWNLINTLVAAQIGTAKPAKNSTQTAFFDKKAIIYYYRPNTSSNWLK
jgi:hypothetical protein